MKKEINILSLKKELKNIFGSKFTVTKRYHLLKIKFFRNFERNSTASYCVYRCADNNVKAFCKEFFHDSEIKNDNFNEAELASEIKKDFYNMLDNYQNLVRENFSSLKKNIEGVKTEDVSDRYLMAKSLNVELSATSLRAKLKELEEDLTEYEISNIILENINLYPVLLKEFIKSKKINKDVKKKAISIACSRWIKAEYHDNYYWIALKYIINGESDTPLPDRLFNLSSNQFPSGVYPSIKVINNISGRIEIPVLESRLPNLEEVTYMSVRSNHDDKRFLGSVADSKIYFNHIDIILSRIGTEEGEEVIRNNMTIIKERKINVEYNCHDKSTSMIISRIKREVFQ